MRTLIRDLPQKTGQEASIKGWLHKARKMGGLNFILVRDRSGVAQVLVEEPSEADKIKGLHIGTVLSVTGKVVEDERAPGGVELHEPKLTVEVPVTEVPPIEIDKPIDHTPENFDTLFEHRPLNLRNLDEQKTFKIRALINQYIRQFLIENEFVEIQTPKLLAGATEGGAEAFKFDYFGQEGTLAQSPQLYKQMMVGVFERVFEIGPAFRAEPSMTSRHMSETTMLDIEMGFIESHDELLRITEDMVNFVIDKLWTEHQELMELAKAVKPTLAESFPRVSVAQVHEMYSQDTDEDTTKEKDLLPAEERWISEWGKKEHGSEAVFVTDFPKAAMKFYHQINPENPETVLWADLIFRGVEIATIPQREHDYQKMIDQIKAAGLDPQHPGYKYYLMAFKFGLPPHGGFGFGIDRFVEKVVGLASVKEATLFPRDMNRLAP